MLDALRKLSTIVRLRRKQLGLSLRGLAKKSGVSSSYISSIEKGMNNKQNSPVVPTIEVLVKLAQGLDISLIELITLSGFDKIHESNKTVETNTIMPVDIYRFVKEDSNAEIFNLLIRLESNANNKHLINLMQSLNNLINNDGQTNLGLEP